MRLIDADNLLEQMRKTSRYFEVKFYIEEQQTIDPETLEIVQKLRNENDELKQRIVFWNRDMIAIQKQEIKALREKLERYEQIEKQGRKDGRIIQSGRFRPATGGNDNG